ncbi:hypothetical protein BT93_L1304 [Corymbia citriodora subsp. variegata]|uniref:Uncharacterized protein n=1 Tax=Corymbia citriodora subsp. variegata TaxID=360336 RepID=A0A8T0CSX7_CORYI|nr:hypothetical protein BT93_L1304 [Corymbia citriodora subsp. variegata]
MIKQNKTTNLNNMPFLCHHRLRISTIQSSLTHVYFNSKRRVHLVKKHQSILLVPAY